MKHSLILSALAGVLTLGLGAAAHPAQAQPSPHIAVTSPDAESVRVRIQAATPQPGRVQVLNLGSGQLLFEEAYTAPVYQHRFCFRNLPAGRYALLLHTPEAQYRYLLQVQNGPAGVAVTLRTIRARGGQLLATAQ